MQVGDGGASGSLGSNSTGVVDNGTLAFDLSVPTTVSQNVSGGGGLTQMGSSVLLLNGANTYSGVTTVAGGGTLQIGDGSTGSVGNTSGFLTNGMLAFNLPGTATVSQPIGGSGGLTQMGPGTLVLASPYTSYSGPTIITGGTLQAGAGGYQFNFIGSGSILDGATVPNNAIPALSGTMHGTGASYVAGPGSSTAIQFTTGQLLKSATGPGALNTFSISFWTETPDTGGPTGQYIFDARAFSGDGTGSAFIWYGDDGWRPYLRIGAVGGGYAYNNWMGEAGSVPFPWPPSGNQWFLTTITVEPGVIEAYVNGQWINSYPITAMPQFQSTGSPLEIGGRVDNSTYFDGSIADFAVYNSFLTAAQVSALYATGLGPVSGNLSASSPVQMSAGVLDLGGYGQTVLSLSDYNSGTGTVTNSGPLAATLTLAPTSGSTTFSGVIQDGTPGARPL